MNGPDEINSSPVRQEVDRLLLEGLGHAAVAHKIKEDFGVEFTIAAVQAYHKEYLKKGDSTIHQMLKLNDDLAAHEGPPATDLERVSAYFSFASTNHDLDMIYDRVKKLKVLADQYPEKDTYDKRIRELLAHAEVVRSRVYRFQYEKIRRAVLMNIGKKICVAAASVLMPYIVREHREEALRRFKEAVEPLLDIGAVPEVPHDAEIEKEFKGPSDGEPEKA